MTRPAPDQPPSTRWQDTDEADCQYASRALEVVGQRWTPSILLTLARGVERFTDITAAVPGLSARMLTVRLKQLEDGGIVDRIVIPTTPVSVRYRLTPRGVDLLEAVHPIAGYIRRWEAAPDRAAARA